MYTGVANKLKMFWRLFLAEAESRVAFPGVAALYRAMHHGLSGDEGNPMLYVSRGPWSIYEMLGEFFQLHGIPTGPLLFLREWGLTFQHPLPHRAEDHKLELIRNMLELYSDLPFVLIGDSGQHDPEIYTQVVQEHPGRVLAVYIRNVTREPERRRAIETLAGRVVEAGSSLVLAADSFVMAEHAAEHGLISSEALSAILSERVEQEGECALKPTRRIEQPSREQTEEAIERGELEEAIEADAGEEAPPNVIVESEDENMTDRAEDRRL
jgi:phosphatidate phosphatase APP1